jgi:hypothetical protein
MKTKKYIQIVQVFDSHPKTDGLMYVGKDGKLRPLKWAPRQRLK